MSCTNRPKLAGITDNAAGVFPSLDSGRTGPDRAETSPGTCSSAAGGAAALLVTDAGRWSRQAVRVGSGGYGRPCTCGPTAFDQALPDLASQAVDQVIAPRMPGYVFEGLKEPQLVPEARQSRAAFTTDGET